MNIKSGAGVVHKYTICTRKCPFEKASPNNSWPLFIPKNSFKCFQNEPFVSEHQHKLHNLF